MKKVMVAAAIAAMAVGAEAAGSGNAYLAGRIPESMTLCWIRGTSESTVKSLIATKVEQLKTAYYEDAATAMLGLADGTENWAGWWKITPASALDGQTRVNLPEGVTGAGDLVFRSLENADGSGYFGKNSGSASTYYYSALLIASDFEYGTDIVQFDLVKGKSGTNQLFFDYGYGDSGTSATGSVVGQIKYQTIPEPTSGLLVLLGVAAMALKRKRA